MCLLTYLIWGWSAKHSAKPKHRPLVHKGHKVKEQLNQLWHNTQPIALNLTAAAAANMWKGNKEKLVEKAEYIPASEK